MLFGLAIQTMVTLFKDHVLSVPMVVVLAGYHFTTECESQSVLYYKHVSLED